MLHGVTVVVEQPDGLTLQTSREFGGFRRDCRVLAAWLSELRVELVVMESTGIYWKSVHAHLENAGITAWVVNAHFIKHVPGRKTDMSDSQWLAVLARFGLVRASFIPPKICANCAWSHATGASSPTCTALRSTGCTRCSMTAASSSAAWSAAVWVCPPARWSRGLVEGRDIASLPGLAHGGLELKQYDLQAALFGISADRRKGSTCPHGRWPSRSPTFRRSPHPFAARVRSPDTPGRCSRRSMRDRCSPGR